MGRSPCCPKEGLNRGAWTAHEDKVLKDYITLHGEGRWRNLPKRAGLKRCGKSCRLRWLNYLRPDIKRGNISSDEEELIIRLHKLLGNRWSLIAGRLPGRTDNEIKNYWNTNLGKKVKDPHRHRHSSSASPPQIRNTATHPNPHTPSSKPLITTTTTTPSTSPPKPDSNNNNNNNNNNVVRTKATKCSKLLLINPLPLPLPNSSMHSHSHSDAKQAVGSVAANNNIADDDSSRVLISSLLLGDDSSEKKELLSATEDLLMMDYDAVGDVCLSDLLNSDDFWPNNINNNAVATNHHHLLSPSSSDQHPHPLMFSDEIFKDWAHSNFAEFNQ